MGVRAQPVKIVRSAPPPPSEACPAKNTSKPSPKPGLLSEAAEKAIVSEALNFTSVARYEPFMGGRTRSQVDRFEDEMRLSPRLPPLEGLNLDEPGAIRWQRMLHAVAKQHGLSANDIMSPSRRKEVVTARFEVFYRFRVELHFSYEKIAFLMKRNHTSVMHGVYKTRDRLLDEQQVLSKDTHSAVAHHSATVEHTHPSPVEAIPGLNRI